MERIVRNKLYGYLRGMTAVLLLQCMFQLNAQSPYSLHWNVDGPLMSIATAVTVGDYLTLDGMRAPAADEIRLLSSESINSFDGVAVGLHSTSADRRSDVGLISAAVSSSVLVGVLPFRDHHNKAWANEFTTLSVMWIETNLINFQATGLTKNLAKRLRPEIYSTEFSIEGLSEDDRIDLRRSFFSRHVSVTAANSFFFASVFNDYFPDSRWNPLVWTGAAVLPAWTGLERILAGKHFPTDVIAGYVFGAACGYLIPYLHRKPDKTSASSLEILPYVNLNESGAMICLRF